MDVRTIRIEDYDYPLTEDRIALHPLEKRDGCKLLVVNSAGKITHSVFSRLPLFLKPETLVIANETKVIRARMEFRKSSGARIEIFLLEPLKPSDYATNFASAGECRWKCLVGNKKRWKEGVLDKILEFGDKKTVLRASLGEEIAGGGNEVVFRWDNPGVSFAEIVEKAGEIPIPPYLRRESEERDAEDYQTVYSVTQGSVAAPTAGLHFTRDTLEELRQCGDEFATVTLHVGAGTFQPVKSEEIGGHPMHSEWISVSRKTIERLISALENGRDILAVGTTSVRTLESLPYFGLLARRGKSPDEVTQWMPYEEENRDLDTIGLLRTLMEYLRARGLESLEANTSIMIAPGFRWRIVNRLVTNFHQPKSTLLLLVSSFLGADNEGKERWKGVYDEALEEGYRFLSYGDACLFTRGRQPVVLPDSKSMALRAAAIMAVRNPESPELLDTLRQVCDDTALFVEGLKKCMESTHREDYTDVHIGEGAAPLRFLMAFAASLPDAKVRIKCGESLKRRPVSPLIDTLRHLGAVIFCPQDTEGVYEIIGKKLTGGDVEADGTFTSQFISALLLVSPLWEDGIRLKETDAPAVSRPYVAMTVRMMEEKCPHVEPDWSAAAFFYENSFMTGKDTEISRLTPTSRSLQGDAVLNDIYSSLGVNTEFRPDGSACLKFDGSALERVRESGVFEYDFRDFPDLVPAVAVGLCYRGIPFRLHGISHLRLKESDRLHALQSILVRLGYGVGIENESLVFDGEFRPMAEFPVEIEPYGDHRIAMAFYPMELAGMVKVEDKAVVAKSFPDFYQQL